MSPPDLLTKKRRLIESLSRLDRLIVAFSGGVDSSFLLMAAQEAIPDRVVAVTATSPLYPQRETDDAIAFAEGHGIRHMTIVSDALSVPEVLANTAQRCYHCKRNLFSGLRKLADDMGICNIAHGANTDDLEDFRPGFRAAREMGIQAPLLDADLSKAEIRTLSREMGLSTWDKPAMACLASRIPFETPLSLEALGAVDRAEALLIELGIRSCRVRYHGTVARIEIEPSRFGVVVSEGNRKRILEHFKAAGFRHVALDLEGYRQGSMNPERKKDEEMT
jgi:pyridinium-3,5-biscarboxylic acid mononucleotide sulfurtransferase